MQDLNLSRRKKIGGREWAINIYFASECGLRDTEKEGGVRGAAVRDFVLFHNYTIQEFREAVGGGKTEGMDILSRVTPF